MGICLIEAMASGKPVVATAVGGIVEVVALKETGILVKPGQPDEMAKAVATLLDDDNMRRVYGTNGRRRVETHFIKEVYGKNMQHIYERAVS